MISADDKTAFAPHIQFLAFDDCPLADAALIALEQAMQQCELRPAEYERVDILDPATDEKLASWGSPTILVDGADVSGQARGDGIGCRLYDTEQGVPTVDTIAEAIRKSQRPS